MAAADSLPYFHPLVRRWFLERVGTPTDAQARAWPAIAEGRHVLVTAPTGSGKTLAAFLWSLDQLLRGAWPGGQVRVLYISPLKALNTDVERNLKAPLGQLKEIFSDAREALPEIQVMTRSGDTSPADRRRMVRRPPEILITTPESLNILLTSQGGRRMFGGLTTVILDEIHAVAGTKRGTHLMTAVERLVPLSGEFQRISISATIRPLERIAAFVGGYRVEEGSGGAIFHPRPVMMVRAQAKKRYELMVRAVPASPTDTAPGEKEPSVWAALAPELRKIIRTNRSTLVFANSRRLTERVTRLVNEEDGGELAYSHHGSLSREIRSVVETRLKEGQLSAIVATSSLELGIDIGSLDEVLLIQTPPSVSSAVQRLGRSGHGVGQTSRGRLYPTHPKDFLDAAVVARAVLDQDIEEVRPVECALDVLAQIIVSMVAAETWQLDDLFDQVRASYSYRQLRRQHFDLVLDMLAGRYAGSRVRELRPRISIDRVKGTVRGRDGVARLVYLSGGTIPDRGYFSLRLLDTKAKLGELDEEFVWERSIGDTFSLGAQSWRVEQVTHNDVLVSPARGSSGLAPFWRADERDRGWHLSERILELLRWAEPALAENDPGGRRVLAELRSRYPLSREAAQALLELLARQREVTGCALPHRGHLVVEHYSDAFGGQTRRQVLLHTLWGGSVNRPFAIALTAAWEEKFGTPVEILQSNDSINVVLGEGVSVENVLELVHEGNLEKLLRRRLEATGFFGARFRHNASRALLLPKASFRSRMPLWLNRQRSKKLLESVSTFEDFPIVMETWRTCLQDELEIGVLLKLLGELRRGEISVSEVYTSAASPFAEDLIWKQTNQLMYEDDTPLSQGGSKVREDLLKELVFSTQLRPRIAGKLAREVEAKLQRTAPGYAPRSVADLQDWLGERLLIPEGEWSELLAAVERDHDLAPQEMEDALSETALRVSLPGAATSVCSVLELPRVMEVLGPSQEGLTLTDLSGTPWAEDRRMGALDGNALRPEEEAGATLPIVVAEWLRAYGPIPQGRLRQVFGLSEDRLQETLASLVEERQVVLDRRTRQADGLEVCDSENLELLLRLGRARARPRFEPLPLERLPLALAAHQGLAEPGNDLEGLQQRLEQLFGYPAPVEAWETEILPARLSPYFPNWLDSLLQNSDCLWFGCGNRRMSFAFREDRALFPPAPQEKSAEVFPEQRGRFTFEDLLEASSLGRKEFTERLWALAWEGSVSTNTLEPVRKGIASRFAAPKAGPGSLPAGRRSGRPWGRRRGGGGRWGGTVSDPGLWFRLELGEAPIDALEEEELRRDRARVLLDRYGVLFRELLARELPQLRWGSVFRSLRLMELSGEILAGQFFVGVPGPQFASHAFFRRLKDELPEPSIYWLGAGDPASLCGVDLPDLKADLPARRRGTHLVYHGSRLVVVSEAQGKRMRIRVPVDHPELPTYLAFLKNLLSREARPMRFVEVREINGEAALDSPYGEVLTRLFSATREARGWRLRKTYERREE